MPAGTSSMASREMSPVMHEQSAINTNTGKVLGLWNPGAEAELGPGWCWGGWHHCASSGESWDLPCPSQLAARRSENIWLKLWLMLS